MTDSSRMQLLTVSILLLIGMCIAIAARQDSGQAMTGPAVEKWILCALIFFYALFSLIGVANDNVFLCRDAVTCFFVGTAVYYCRNIGWIVQTPAASILSLIVMLIVLILVTPLAGFMMRLRCGKTDDAAAQKAGTGSAAAPAAGPKSKSRIGQVSQSVRARFQPAIAPAAQPVVPQSGGPQEPQSGPQPVLPEPEKMTATTGPAIAGQK